MSDRMKFECGWLDSKWTVALASCVITLLTNGITRMVPLFFVASVERYHVNREEASFPYVLRFQIEFLTGPLIGYLGCKYGVLTVTKLGCVLSVIGIGMCFFAESILTMNFCYGLLLGMGCGMSRQLLPVIISNRFKKNLSLANGICLMGSSLGCIVFSPLYETLLEVYHLSGTFLLSSALVAHAIPAAMLLKTSKHTTRTENVDVESAANNPKEVHPNPNSTEESRHDEYYCPDSEHAIRSKQYMKLSRFKKYHQSGEVTESMKILEGTHEHMTLENSGDGSSINEKTLISPELLFEETRKYHCSTSMNIAKDYIHMCPENKSNGIQKVSVDNSQEFVKKAENLSTLVKTRKDGGIVKAFSIFLDPLFLFLSLNQSLFLMTFITFTTVIVDFSRDVHVPKHCEVYILICIAISDLFGRVCLCWIPDKGYMDISNFSAACFIALGASFTALSFSTSFLTVMFAVFCTSVILGVQRTLCPGVVPKFFDGEKETTAMASVFLLVGPLSFTISPLIGFFRTQLGSYVRLFWLISGVQIYCGLIQYSLSIFGKYRKRKLDEIEEPI